MLKPQDLVVLLKLAAHPGAPWTYASLAAALKLSSSEVHGALQRAEHAGLYTKSARRPIAAALREFTLHGARYAFAPERLGLTRGMPTGSAAPVLAGQIARAEDDLPPVWPSPEGTVRGEGVEPLYPSVPLAAGEDPELYALLALVDALRLGRARERRVAEEKLERMLAP